MTDRMTPTFRDPAHDPTDHHPEDDGHFLTSMGLTAFLPEHKLLIACIERAAWDYAGHAKTPQHVRRSAERWLVSPSRGPWAYRWMLAQLTDEPEALRARIARGLERMRDTNPEVVAWRAENRPPPAGCAGGADVLRSAHVHDDQSRTDPGHPEGPHPDGPGPTPRPGPVDDQRLAARPERGADLGGAAAGGGTGDLPGPVPGGSGGDDAPGG